MNSMLSSGLRSDFGRMFHKASGLLAGNFKALGPGKVSVLLAGGGYRGIWIEHNQDNLFITDIASEAAWNSQRLFIDGQRGDGLIPFAVTCSEKAPDGAWRFGQIQSVLPFARCALEIALKLGRPEEDFAAIYRCAARFDQWLVKYRNTRKSGLVEMFCEYDTGHDNSPRVHGGGIPRSCPGADACNLAPAPELPLLSCDLSAMRYGALEALEELAARLGDDRAASCWREKREELRSLMFRHLYDAEDDFFYDGAPDGTFRRYRTEHVTRFFLNRVVTSGEFDRIYNRYFVSPGKEFRPAFPIPSVSVDDPHFDHACPFNSWGSNSQALTMLRALLWMEHYGRGADLEEFLALWIGSVIQDGGKFTQELNPFTGAPVGTNVDYTPALLLILEYGRRHPELVG